MFKHKCFSMCAGLILSISSGVFSQTIGIKAGPVYNHFISNQQHVKGNIGVVAGVAYHYDLSGPLSLATGLEYLQLGGGLLTIEDNTRFGVDPYLDPFATEVRDSKVTLHTVNLPILVNYQIVGDNTGGITLGIGPEVSYTIKGTSQDIITLPYGVSEGYWVSYSQTNLVTDSYSPFNVAASANLGFDFMAGNMPFCLNFKYRYGLTPIIKGYSYLDLANLKSSVYQGSFLFTIEYKFNLSSNVE
jgi:hypothetical protein